MADNKLTAKQEAFILAYLETGNASEAYRRAYNALRMNAATVNREAHSLLEHPKVAPRLKDLRNRVTNQAVEHVALSRAWVLDRLMRHAQVCLGEIPLRLKLRKAHSADVMEQETHQRDASAANRALELLGREVNLFTEKREIGKPGDFDHMSDEELNQNGSSPGSAGEAAKV
jgi:phage terminase small subunit